MEKKYRGLGRNDMLFAIAMLTIVIGFFSFIPYIPDQNPKTIKRELKKQGYDVEGIEFVKDERYEESVYQSSKPIFYEGNDESLWSIIWNHRTSIMTFIYSVEPYHPPKQ